nr:FimD/PapC N-terminal domain-containing protein [Enterobacter bugandensis]
MLAFCLTALAFSIRAEINPSANESVDLARAIFDTDALKNQGLDPAIADYYSVAPRFAPGYHNVTVNINGKQRTLMPVKFDEDGAPCIDNDFLENAGLLKKTDAAPVLKFINTGLARRFSLHRILKKYRLSFHRKR